MAADYRQDYSQHGPHSSLGDKTLHEFKGNWHHNNQELTTDPASTSRRQVITL